MNKKAIGKFSSAISVILLASLAAPAFADGGGCDDICNHVNINDPSAGQVNTQCAAYRAASDAAPWQYMILALDVATAGVCAGACAMGGEANAFNQGLVQACSYAGMGAGGSEILATIAQKSGPVQKAIQAAGAAAGAGLGYATNSGVSQASQGLKQQGQGAKKVGDSWGKQCAEGDSCGDEANELINAEKAEEGEREAEAGLKNFKEGREKAQKMACFTAAAFAAMSGLRYYNIHNENEAKAKACEAVRKLASSAPALINGVNAAAMSGGTAGAGGSGGSMAARRGGAGMSDAQAAINCIAGGNAIGSCPVPQSMGQATDANLLNRSGLDRNLGKNANIDLDAFKQRVEAAGGPGNMLGGGGGGFSAAMGNLATVAHDNARELSGLVGMGDVPLAMLASAGGGSGAGGRGGSGAGDNPFGSLAALLGGPDGSKAGSGRGIDSIGFGPGRGDIWHSGTDRNIFEIISQKIEKVSHRVQ